MALPERTSHRRRDTGNVREGWADRVGVSHTPALSSVRWSPRLQSSARLILSSTLSLGYRRVFGQAALPSAGDSRCLAAIPVRN
jgi:hypothetical protein